MPSPKPLYSAFDKALESLLRNKGTGSEFLGELTKKAGVKQAEIQERGLDKALGSLPKVDKAEVQKIVKKNPPARVEVKTKMENPYLHPDFNEIRNEVVEQHTPHDDYGRPMRRFSESEANEMAVDALGGPAQYYEHQLPNNKNYREMLLQLPEDLNPYKNYYSPHWDEPNVLAHMRLSDRVGPNGEKVLHLEELQSDWHQEGRDKGYGKKLVDMPKMSADELLNEHDDDLKPEQKKYLKDFMNKWESAEYNGRENDLNNLTNQYQDWVSKQTIGAGVPDAPFKKNWEELALKHLVNHAVENGYDKIAITPGAVQADRYDLSRQVDRIAYNPENGYFQVMQNGKSLAGMPTNLSKDELPNYIGKDLSNKLLSSEPVGQGMHQLQGDDLKIGGEGMKAAYDQRIPNILNKIGKSFGSQTELNAMPVEKEPAKVFVTNRNDPEDRYPAENVEWAKKFFTDDKAHENYFIDEQPAQITNLHTFDVTPQLSEKAQTEGFPLYKRGGKVQISTNPDTHWAETKFKRK